MSVRKLAWCLAFVLLVLAFWSVSRLAWANSAAAPAQPAATVSGVIRHAGMPVSGVMVVVVWDGGTQADTTGSDGRYSVSGLPAPGQITIRVHPPLPTGLAHETYAVSISGDLTKDFDLVPGHRLQAQVLKPDGSPYTGFSPSLKAIGALPIEASFSAPAMDPSGQIDLFLRPGFYDLGHQPEIAPYYLPPAIFDLTEGNVVGAVVTLRYHSGPIPDQPPDARRITVGPPDENGFAPVTGAPGSVPPRAEVLVVNLNAGSLDVTVSDAAGAFSANLFAPPGSSLLVKYDVFGDTLTDLWYLANATTRDVVGRFIGVVDYSTGDLPLLPGTMLYVGSPPPGSETGQAFDSAAALISSDPRGWAGLWLAGTLHTDPHGFPGPAVLPGETISITAHLQAFSPDVTCTPPPTFTFNASLVLHYQFGVDGRANAGIEDFRAYMFTPTGLPINHPAGGRSFAGPSIALDNWTCAGAHSFRTDALFTWTLPADLPEGVYVPQILLSSSDMPLSADLPLMLPWYHVPGMAFLPPVTVGEPATPRLPMVIFPDTTSNGHRGVAAMEDQDAFRMINWVVFPPTQVVIPRLDERTGEPLRHSMEPGSNWLAVTDRRIPKPLHIPLQFPSGSLTIHITKPQGGVDTLGPAPLRQSSLRTPSTPGGFQIGKRSGTLGDVYQPRTMDEDFAYSFDQDGVHLIEVSGAVADIYGNTYLIQGTYEVVVARILDLDPGQLPTTPYVVGGTFAPGLHVFPPGPAQVEIRLVHMPHSDPAQAITHTITGQANRFGYFQPPAGTEFRFAEPGEFRVDISAVYEDAEGTLWAGFATWGNVVEGQNPLMEAHGRRGMDYTSPTIDDMSAWFIASNLPPDKIFVDTYYPYFSGDIHWGGPLPLDSIQPCISVRDLTGPSETIYGTLRNNVHGVIHEFRNPPSREPSLENLNKRAAVGEAPLFIATEDNKDPSLYPESLRLLGYWYGTSERPGVRVREVVSVDMLGVGYWGFDDNYTYQIGVPADGDQPGDLKWEFGGAVLRVISETNPMDEYAIYSSLWVLLPDDDALGGRITPPFQDATGASVNGGPIMTLLGEDIDMLFLPLGIRPGDILQLGDVVAFSGHVGPPLDSRVEVTITSPSGGEHSQTWHANKIGWLYDPSFDFVASEPGRWTVDVFVEHDRSYPPTGVTPQSHNTGTVLGTAGRYEFYVVEPSAPALHISAPEPGFIVWPDYEVEPIPIRGRAPAGTASVYYTIHDKGVVMGQGILAPDPGGLFTLVYDAKALHKDFPMLSLTAREGRWEGLADEVSIHLLAVGSETPRAATVTLIGEEVFVHGGEDPGASYPIYLPLVVKDWAR